MKTEDGKTEHKVIADGFILGNHYVKGGTVRLAPGQEGSFIRTGQIEDPRGKAAKAPSKRSGSSAKED